MTFPTIEHIDDVLPSLAGRDEFVIANKGDYTVIDYRYALVDSFEDPIRKECRGLKFAPDGRLIARPLHKFFNYGEKPESSNLDFSLPHAVVEKMDGSMIHPCQLAASPFDAGGLRFMTRMGVTDVAKAAENHFLNETLAHALCVVIDDGYTPVFEYVGPDNRIVEEYAEPKLVLLQVRDMLTGEYLNAIGVADTHRLLTHNKDGERIHPWLELAPSYAAFAGDQDIAAVYARSKGEGVIVQFAAPDQLFVKIKTEEYRRLHRLRDNVAREHDLVRLILDGSLDDCLPLFDVATAAKVQDYADTVLKAIRKAVMQVRSIVLTGEELDQKTFATQHVANLSAPMKSCAFSARKLIAEIGELPNFDTVVRNLIYANLINRERFERIRPLIGDGRFDTLLHLGELAEAA